ncbi:MAG: hypothetical protein ACK5HT_14715 [Draconibacterium sp.]
MKRLSGLVLLVTVIAISACSPKVSTNLSKSYTPLDYEQEVKVFALDEITPDNSEVIGQVKIGDSGFTTNCSYEVVIDKAKLEARKAGGNAIKIIDYKTPSVMGSSCHRIIADILNVDGIENYATEVKSEELLDIDYAILNVYRFSGVGPLIGYDLYLGDSVICRVKNNYKTTIHIDKGGLNTLWAKTESKSEVPIDVQPGKTYYLRCSLKMGAFVGRPKLELIDSKTGKVEFESFKAKNQ